MASIGIHTFDEDDDWIPLDHEEALPASTESPCTTTTPSTVSATSIRNEPPAVTSRSENIPSSRRQESIRDIQMRLETRQKIKQGLVEHPMNQFCGRFFIHLAEETWNQDAFFRAGLILVAIGTVLKLLWMLSISTQLWFHPTTIFLVAVLCLSLFYLLPTVHMEKHMDDFFHWIATPSAVMDTAVVAIERIPLRWICLALLLLPVMLEARALSFLATIIAEAGWISNIAAVLLISVWMLYQHQIANVPPRDCSLQGMTWLYAVALIISIVKMDVQRAHLLAGSFCLATGAMLLVHVNEDDSRHCYNRLIRHALRLTLRDVLETVGERVQEDEMLQIAMLRWIVDYWSSTHATTDTTTPPPAESKTTAGPTLHSVANRNTVTNEQATATQQQAASTVKTRTCTNQQSLTQRLSQQELQWDELWPMLSMTTDQMIDEVHAPTTVPELFTTQHEQNRSSTGTATATDDSGGRTNGSLENLTAMLASMDVDDRAKPAVEAYKQALETCPPPRWMAEVVAVVLRCPATLSLGCFYILGSSLAVPTTITLAPFISFEVWRVKKWIKACQLAHSSISETQQSGDATASYFSLPYEMHPMSILLSEDNHLSFSPSPLIQVWENMLTSITALERGLTATRCVRTTAVVAEFAGDVMSLAHLGIEVSQKGWLHGIGLLSGEFLHSHAQSAEQRDTNPGSGARYTRAAVSAMKNGQIVAHNVGVLLEGRKGHGNPFVDPVVGFASALVGRGWMWGKEGEVHPIADAAESSEPQVDGDVSVVDVVSAQIKNADGVKTCNESFGNTPCRAGGGKDDKVVDDCVQKVESRDITMSVLDPSPGSSNIDTGALEAVASKDRKDVSGLLEKIADAFEQDLITKDEKNNFMESLAVQSRHDAIRKTLDCVLHEGELSGLLEQVADAFERNLISEDEKNSFIQSLVNQSKQEVVRKSLNCVFQEAELQLGHLPEPKNISISSTNDNFRARQIQDSNDSVAGMSADTDCILPDIEEKPVAWSESKPSICVREIDFSLEVAASEGCRARADADSETSISDATPAPTRNTTSESIRGATVSEYDGEQWVKWVGGGLAFVGAMVGGMALAQNGGNASANSGGSSQRREEEQRTTPYIEEIEEDDDTNADEWTAVPSSNETN